MELANDPPEIVIRRHELEGHVSEDLEYASAQHVFPQKQMHPE